MSYLVLALVRNLRLFAFFLRPILAVGDSDFWISGRPCSCWIFTRSWDFFVLPSTFGFLEEIFGARARFMDSATDSRPF